MEIQYEIVPEDITYFSKESAKGTSVYELNVLLYSVLVILFLLGDMLMAVVAVFRNDGSIKVDSINILPRLVIGLVILGIYYVAMMTISKRSARKLFASSGKNGLFCKHTLKIDDNGFDTQTHVDRCFISWKGVEKIIETKSYVAICVRLGSRYFIPKRAFANARDIKIFVDTVQIRISEAETPPRAANLDGEA